MSEMELKACPFCDGEAAFEQIGSRVLAEGCAWSVGCENEQCLGFQSVTTYARKAEAAAAWNTRPADAITALSEDNARLRKVLEEIAGLEQRPFDFPADWSEQMASCEDCKRYEGHPVQRGICDTHRRPLWDRERHDKREETLIGYRAKTIARDTLAALQHEGGGREG